MHKTGRFNEINYLKAVMVVYNISLTRHAQEIFALYKSGFDKNFYHVTC